MWWVGVRMISVPKPVWSSESLAKFQLPCISRSGLKVPGGVVWCSVVWCGGVVEAHFSVQLKCKERDLKKKLQNLVICPNHR